MPEPVQPGHAPYSGGVTTVVQASPAPLSRVWTPRKVIAEDLTGEDLGDVLELHSDAFAWWILPRAEVYGPDELRAVAPALGLDELALHDLLAQDRRAKFEVVEQARLVITNAVTVDRDRAEVRIHPVAMVVTDRALVCLADDSSGFRPGRLLTRHADALAHGGVESALQTLVAGVIASYEDAVEWLEDASDDLAETLFGERPLTRSQQLQAFRLRSALSQLRRLTEPMRAVLADLLANPVPAGKKGAVAAPVRRRWSLIEERHQRVAGAADALRETLSSIFDASLALSDLRMNEVMKKLTAWAAIIAVPTLVTGFVGMNVGFPLHGTTGGFWVYLAIMLAASAVLYLVFRIKQWI